MQMGLVWPSGAVCFENQDFSKLSANLFFPSPLPLPSSFLAPFLSPFPLDSPRCGGGVHYRYLLPPLTGAADGLCFGRDCNIENHVVTNVRVVVQSIVEVPMFLIDEQADLFHQEAVC